MHSDYGKDGPMNLKSSNSDESASDSNTITIDLHLSSDWARGAMREDITRAFTRRPRVLPPKWLYDDRGSELFDAITRLDEYYPTEAEREILDRRASEIVSITGARTVVELGSGTSDKTKTLLDAFWDAGQLERFVPLDVSEATLVSAAEMLAERYDGLEVHAVVGDFTRHLGQLPHTGDRLVAFLGGTLGNFYEEERRAFLGSMADSLDTGEWLLVGVDLVKDVQRIIDAYYDSSGVTEAFIKNVIVVLNRELGGNLPVDQFDYVPFWDARQERMDLRLRVLDPISGRLDGLDLDVELEAGDEIQVEVSTKFRTENLDAELVEAGFEPTNFWTDDNQDFGLVLARRI